ncbi:MAG: hypothetical protein OHK0039_37170 [Bacteroidia bacterium]
MQCTDRPTFALYKQPIFSFALILLVLFYAPSIHAQDRQRDSTFFFRNVLSVNHNGFSLIPSFSLGRPALVYEPAIGNRRMSFEPQFRYALDGKPWSFVFIYRYKLIHRNKFSLTAGAHVPALVFATQTAPHNGSATEALIARRFLAAELLPSYAVTDNVSVGMYLLRGHGFDGGGTTDSHYAGLRGTFKNIPLGNRLLLRFDPQLYWLKTDDTSGVYFTSTQHLAVRAFPLSLSSIVNKAIQTRIPGKDFDWNVSLVYTFGGDYVRKGLKR